MINNEKILQTAKRVLEIESQSLTQAISYLNKSFLQAASIILETKGKLVFSGMGKSGLIARKLASTFSSTGTSSVFLHPAEAAHGDLGVLSSQDVLIVFSQSGRSSELQSVLRYAARLGCPIIVFTGKLESEMAQLATSVVSTAVDKEACPLGLAPTASSSVALAMGDALAMAVSEAKGFTSEGFRALHPGGGLGQKLLRVKDIMHDSKSLPLLTPEASLKEVIVTMSRGDVKGACGIVNSDSQLVGIITDGDIRRKIDNFDNPLVQTAEALMNSNPRTIDGEELAEKALFIMEEFRISVLFVLDRKSEQPLKPVGLIHIQDLIGKILT